MSRTHSTSLLLLLTGLHFSSALTPFWRSGILTKHTAALTLDKLPRTANPLLTAATPSDTKLDTNTWQPRLVRVSVVASILCAIDCTILPAMLVLVPALNLGGSSSAFLHKVSHQAAIWFVTPIGSAALAANWFQHRCNLVGVWGMAGLCLILLANLHLPHGLLPHTLEHALHAFHSVVSLTGCALLLSSQWYSNRLLRKMGKCCAHNHVHTHGHNH
mmetsp:Transcript_12944/g.39510  ORF Transcript_12944/g.39510 Transcript_12944/m.39510 type:complete len:217 (+) Transcript_12944:40-690(+)